MRETCSPCRKFGHSAGWASEHHGRPSIDLVKKGINHRSAQEGIQEGRDSGSGSFDPTPCVKGKAPCVEGVEEEEGGTGSGCSWQN